MWWHQCHSVGDRPYRTERDLVKIFDDLDIDWSLVEKQFIKWGELFRACKKLRVSISFNYTDSYQSSARTQRGGNKRGSSATQWMLVELDAATQLDADQEGSCQPSAWKEGYAVCPPCNKGPYCWFSTAFSCIGITSALQASLRQPRYQPFRLHFQLYRLHFGNPEISPTGFHFHHFLPNYSMEC